MDIRLTKTRFHALFEGISELGQLWMLKAVGANQHLIGREFAEDFIESIHKDDLTVED